MRKREGNHIEAVGMLFCTVALLGLLFLFLTGCAAPGTVTRTIKFIPETSRTAHAVVCVRDPDSENTLMCVSIEDFDRYARPTAVPQGTSEL